MIRLAVAVGIIAAIGFFIVKPILDTTEPRRRQRQQGLRKELRQARTSTPKRSKKQINKSIEDVNGQVQVQVEHSFHTAKVHGGDKRTEKLLHCVQRANGNVHRMERCAKKY